MKFSSFGLLLVIILSAVLVSRQSIAQSQQSPKRYSKLSLTPYNPKRSEYELLPVKVSGVGGGKLGSKEKFEIFVFSLKNEASRSVKAVRFSYYIFKSDNLDDAVYSRQTDLFPVDLPALEQRKVTIHIVDVDDIPALAYKEGEEFRLEVAITEVHYNDGSLWQATNFPGKENPGTAP